VWTRTPSRLALRRSAVRCGAVRCASAATACSARQAATSAGVRPAARRGRVGGRCARRTPPGRDCSGYRPRRSGGERCAPGCCHDDRRRAWPPATLPPGHPGERPAGRSHRFDRTRRGRRSPVGPGFCTERDSSPLSSDGASGGSLGTRARGVDGDRGGSGRLVEVRVGRGRGDRAAGECGLDRWQRDRHVPPQSTPRDPARASTTGTAHGCSPGCPPKLPPGRSAGDPDGPQPRAAHSRHRHGGRAVWAQLRRPRQFRRSLGLSTWGWRRP
jgi:hypothetical protein